MPRLNIFRLNWRHSVRNRPMIITDKGVRSNNLLAPIEAAFESTDAVIGYVFDDVPQDSSCGDSASCGTVVP